MTERGGKNNQRGKMNGVEWATKNEREVKERKRECSESRKFLQNPSEGFHPNTFSHPG